MEMHVQRIVQSIVTLLESKKNSKIAADKTRFFRKHENLKFYGIQSVPLLQAFREFCPANVASLGKKDKLEIAGALVASEYCEQKLFGIQLLAKNVKSFTLTDLTSFGDYFTNKYIDDWLTSDSICSKVFAEMIKLDENKNKGIVPAIVKWKDSDNYWKQRASCVSFIRLARFGKHTESIVSVCSTCVKSPERFVQLGMGWVLREVSLSDQKLVINFIKNNYHHFSREGLRYALEKMDDPLRQQLLNYKQNGNVMDDTTSKVKQRTKKQEEEDCTSTEEVEEEEQVEEKSPKKKISKENKKGKKKRTRKSKQDKPEVKISSNKHEKSKTTTSRKRKAEQNANPMKKRKS